MRYYRKCNDCGGDLGEQNKSTRRDICDDCWDNRGWLLNNREMICPKSVLEVQRAMVNHRGTAKRIINKLKKKLEGVINEQDKG